MLSREKRHFIFNRGFPRGNCPSWDTSKEGDGSIHVLLLADSSEFVYRRLKRFEPEPLAFFRARWPQYHIVKVTVVSDIKEPRGTRHCCAWRHVRGISPRKKEGEIERLSDSRGFPVMKERITGERTTSSSSCRGREVGRGTTRVRVIQYARRCKFGRSVFAV